MNALLAQLPAPLLAQGDLLGGAGTWTAIGIIAVLAFLVSLGLVVVARYKRCPSNRILVNRRNACTAAAPSSGR